MLLFTLFLLLIFTCEVFALTAEEAEQQIESQGKEIVSGNILIWFLCAVAFLKVSQKIDSFMSALGIHVGKTGGSLLGEAMIAAKGLARAGYFAQNGSYGKSSTSEPKFLEGGLAGAVGRMFTRNAMEHITGQKDTLTSAIAKAAYDESISRHGTFSNQVIGEIAKGNIQNGSIKGEEAITAFQYYMGMQKDASIAEKSANTDMAQQQNANISYRKENMKIEYGSGNAAVITNGLENTISPISTIENQRNATIFSGHENTSADTTAQQKLKEKNQFVSAQEAYGNGTYRETMFQNTLNHMTEDGAIYAEQPTGAEWLPDSPIVSLENTVSEKAIEQEQQTGYGIENDYGVTNRLEQNVGYGAESSTAAMIPEQTGFQTQKDIVFSNMEIGGGRMTGTETSPAHTEGIPFAMYHTDKYMAPEGKYQVLQAIDGSKWYHQYAKDVMEKEYYMKDNGNIAYKETLVKKLPPAPKRKDNI